MKITKRQLRRIIKEEKAKLLRESVTDMSYMEEGVSNSSVRLAETFMNLMYELFQEDPGMFTGRSTQAEWEQQVDEATNVLEAELREAMNEVIQRIETQLHDGQYHRG